MKPGDLVVADGPLYTENARTKPVGIILKNLGKMRKNGIPSGIIHYLVMTRKGDLVDYREYELNVFSPTECAK